MLAITFPSSRQNHWNSLGFVDILKFIFPSSRQNQWNSYGFINNLKFTFPSSRQNHWNSLGVINILKLTFPSSRQNHSNSLSFIPFWSLRFPWTHRNHCFSCLKSTKTCLKTMDVGRGGGPNGKHFSKIGLATERISRHWSVVSCVRCGCVGAGLGFPVGGLRFAPFSPPTSDVRKKLNLRTNTRQGD